MSEISRIDRTSSEPDEQCKTLFLENGTRLSNYGLILIVIFEFSKGY